MYNSVYETFNYSSEEMLMKQLYVYENMPSYSIKMILAFILPFRKPFTVHDKHVIFSLSKQTEISIIVQFSDLLKSPSELHT